MAKIRLVVSATIEETFAKNAQWHQFELLSANEHYTEFQQNEQFPSCFVKIE